MSIIIAALAALVISVASLDQGGGVDPDGVRCAASASAVTPDAGVRIDPEG